MLLHNAILLKLTKRMMSMSKHNNEEEMWLSQGNELPTETIARNVISATCFLSIFFFEISLCRLTMSFSYLPSDQFQFFSNAITYYFNKTEKIFQCETMRYCFRPTISRKRAVVHIFAAAAASCCAS